MKGRKQFQTVDVGLASKPVGGGPQQGREKRKGKRGEMTKLMYGFGLEHSPLKQCGRGIYHFG